ncbi:hypothetical protein AAFJ72_18725 [Brevibacillus gelatini]|uniref:hypothetical protein n=1 Tax=Brevibacillus gelatini TaxID=1655277 RepID=UPI003D819882
MNWIAWMIVACEIGFWVVIALGLAVRYGFGKERLGLFILALTPLVDLVLLAVTSVDLYQGATATRAHALAAVYIGVSIAFGKGMIHWADEKFLYYVKKQPLAKKPKLYGMAYARYYAKGWFKHVFAYLIGAGLLFAMIFFVGDASRTGALERTISQWAVIVGIDFLITVSFFVWPKRSKSVSS